MNIDPGAHRAFGVIGLNNHLKDWSIQYNDYEHHINKIEKAEILKILSSLGYNFRYRDQCYVLMEEMPSDIKFYIVFNLKNGIFLTYFNIAIKDGYINLASGNLLSIGRKFYGCDEVVQNPVFNSYNQFLDIAKKVLGVYEDLNASSFLIYKKMND